MVFDSESAFSIKSSALRCCRRRRRCCMKLVSIPRRAIRIRKPITMMAMIADGLNDWSTGFVSASSFRGGTIAGVETGSEEATTVNGAAMLDDDVIVASERPIEDDRSRRLINMSSSESHITTHIPEVTGISEVCIGCADGVCVGAACGRGRSACVEVIGIAVKDWTLKEAVAAACIRFATLLEAIDEERLESCDKVKSAPGTAAMTYCS